MQTKWDLSKLYKPPLSEEEFEKQLQDYYDYIQIFVQKWNPKMAEGFRDDYLKDVKILKEALEDYEELNSDPKEFERLSEYYHLATSLDQLDPQLKARENKINDIEVKISNEILFFTQRIAKISKEQQSIILSDPSLKEFEHFLERLFVNAQFLLSEPEEKILRRVQKASYSNWVDLLSEQLTKSEAEILEPSGQRSIKSFSDIIGLIDNTNKEVRDLAAIELNKILAKNVEIAEAELNSVLENKKINDELRQMPRPDTSRHIRDDIDSEVVDVLRESVSGFNSISREFYSLKAKLLKLQKLEYHERNVPILQIDKTYAYEEAVDLVRRAMKRLNPIFLELLEEFLDGRIDVYPAKGKRSGAFCTDGSKKINSYILLNFTGKLQDVLTLAHELGHGIHFELMRKKQNSLNFGASMATAEVASTFLEDFILQELLLDASPELKLSLNMTKLGDDISTIIRQVACYNLEYQLHIDYRKKGFLSKSDIGELFKIKMLDYMGESVNFTEGSENWWVYWSHLRYYFYVYSYASGLLISKSLQKSTKENHEFVNLVIKFLEAGESKSPKDIFKELGLDITKPEFWSNGILEVQELLEETKKIAADLNLI